VLEGGGRGDAGKAVLLITDGEDQRGDALGPPPRSQSPASDIRSAGGWSGGRAHPGPGPLGQPTGYKKDKQGRTVLTRTDSPACAS